MGADGDPPVGDQVLCVAPGEARRLDAPARLLTEDGTELQVRDRLPLDLPVGYHRLPFGAPAPLDSSSPRSLLLPESLHTWGWAVQLYALRSRAAGALATLTIYGAWRMVAGARGRG